MLQLINNIMGPKPPSEPCGAGGGGAFRHHRIEPTISNGVKEVFLTVCVKKVNKRPEAL